MMMPLGIPVETPKDILEKMNELEREIMEDQKTFPKPSRSNPAHGGATSTNGSSPDRKNEEDPSLREDLK